MKQTKNETHEQTKNEVHVNKLKTRHIDMNKLKTRYMNKQTQDTYSIKQSLEIPQTPELIVRVICAGKGT